LTRTSNADAVESFAAQTEGDTGYDYNDIYDEDYEEESGKQAPRIHEIQYTSPDECLFQKALLSMQFRFESILLLSLMQRDRFTL